MGHIDVKRCGIRRWSRRLRMLLGDVLASALFSNAPLKESFKYLRGIIPASDWALNVH